MPVEEDQDAGIPEWVVTFGDMMSLLLTFFIMLVSMSEIKREEDYMALVESMRKRFGHDLSMEAIVPGDAKPRNSAIMNIATMGRARRANTMRGGDKTKAPVGEHPRVQMVRPADQAHLSGVIFFDEFGSQLSEESKRRLQSIAGEIGGKPQKIEVRGHSSRRPLPKNSQYRDHWHLAYDRAYKTMRFLLELGIEPQRIRLAVAGDHEPVYSGVDLLELAKNARVEVLLLNERAEDLDASAAAKNISFPDR